MNAKEAKTIMENYDISSLQKYIQDSIMHAAKSGKDNVDCYIAEMSQSNLQKLLNLLYKDGYKVTVKILFIKNYELKISWA